MNCTGGSVVGSSGIEKNIDLMLCLRFKGRRIRWTRAGESSETEAAEV
jgi:hypothetical protein